MNYLELGPWGEQGCALNQSEIHPSRWYYALAAGVFLGGWVLFGLFLFKSLSGLSGKLKQVVVPGKAEITLSTPGKYTIFYEFRSVVGNRVYSTERSLSGLECSVISKSSGSQIPLARAAASSTYSMGGREGTSLFDFRIDQPGTYEISASYPEGREGPEVVLAVGQGFATKIVTTVLGGLATVFGSMAVAIAIAVVTLIKREKAKKQLKGPAAQYRPLE